MVRYAKTNTMKILPIPKLLIELSETGKWKHPGDDLMFEKIPFIKESLVFLDIEHEQDLSVFLLDKSEEYTFGLYRGSVIDERELPWLDVEKSRIILCNKYPGDDVAIALDYRIDESDPCVVGSEWLNDQRIIWREISPDFRSFSELIGINTKRKLA